MWNEQNGLCRGYSSFLNFTSYSMHKLEREREILEEVVSWVWDLLPVLKNEG